MLEIIKQSFKISWSALLANKVRSFLTMLGIVIGVGAVVLVMALGSGAQSLILGQISGLGSDLVGVTPGKSEDNGPPAAVMGVTITTLSTKDLQAISELPEIVSAAGYASGFSVIDFQSFSYDTNVNGVSASYLEIEGGEVLEGRFYSSEEEKALARVVVLGSTVKNELFGDGDALGARVKISGQMFEVIGVMEPRGKIFFQDYDDQVIVPLATMQKLILGIDYLNFLRAKAFNKDNPQEAVEAITVLLRERHGITDQSGLSDDFSSRSISSAIDLLTTITDSLKIFLVAMAALALFVGGIGIMNIMLVAVTQRTREIGLRRALGATRQDIILQFLSEASFLTLLGGTIGIVFGVFVSWLVALVVNYLGYDDYQFAISAMSLFLSLGVSMLVGLVFGLFPALKASKHSPVESLSYE